MTKRDASDKETAGAGDRLVSVRRVDDEATGLMLAEFLKDQGIEANVHTVRMPWLGGVELMQRGFWGHVEVLEGEADRARSLLDDFYAAHPEPGPSAGGDDPEDKPRKAKR
jgi:hypothetical protein